MQRALNNLLVSRKHKPPVPMGLNSNEMSEAFFEFCSNVLPNMEEKVETTILRELYNKSKNKLIQKEILNSFKRRKLDINFKAHSQSEDYVHKPTATTPDPGPDHLIVQDLRNMNSSYISYPFEIPEEMALHCFQTGFFGYKQYIDNYVAFGDRYMFLFTSEMFKITEMLKRLKRSNEFLFEESRPEDLNVGTHKVLKLGTSSGKQDFTLKNVYSNLDEEGLFSQIVNIQGTEYLYKDEQVYMNVLNICRDEFREIINCETRKWVHLPAEVVRDRILETKPDRFHNYLLDGPDNVYTNYLKNLELDDLSGELLYEKIKKAEEEVIAHDKRNAEFIERLSGHLPRNEIVIDENTVEHEVDERDYSHLKWDDPDMPIVERDRRNKEVEILNNMFTECFLFDAITNFLTWHLHVPEVRERIFSGEKRVQMFQAIINQIMAHEKREFITPQKPEIYFQIMKEIDLGGDYFLDCTFYDPNLSENAFRKKYHPMFGKATAEEKKNYIEEKRKLRKHYDGFEMTSPKFLNPHLKISPFQHVNVPDYDNFHVMEDEKQNSKNLENYIEFVKTYNSKIEKKKPLKPEQTIKKQKEIMEGSIEDLESTFYKKEKKVAPLKLSLQDAQNLHLKVPKDLHDLSIHNFSGHQSGLLIWGQSGSGKSGALLGLSAWAYVNEWVVLKIPSVFELTQKTPLKNMSMDDMADAMSTNEGIKGMQLDRYFTFLYS
jgi:hypothetical protein